MASSDVALEALLDIDHPIKRAASSWAAEHLADPRLADRDRGCEFWAEGFRRIADAGYLARSAPLHDGGTGAPLAETLLELEGLGYGCEDNGLTFAVAAQIVSTQNALQRFADREQKQRYLSPLLRGERFAGFCMSEPGSGSDAFAVSTTAEATGDGYVLRGHKSWVTFAPVADFFVVFAATRPGGGRWGLSAFLVDAATPGLSVRAGWEKMGRRTTPFGDVVLDGCVVPAENRVGPEGAGASMFAAVMDDERAFLFAPELGAMERLIHASVCFARQRHQFGEPIGAFQAVSHRLADMKLRHETARALMYKTALLADRRRPVTLSSALTKLVASEGSVATALAAMQVHGARGYVTDFGVERHARDALGGLFTSGTSDIQRNIVAGLMGL